MIDDNNDPYYDPYNPNGDQYQYPNPGANNGSGPWAPGYDPGSNYNGGNAPAPSSPYNDYNGGSPVNAPLQSGYGWEWSGPQSPMWNMASNNWDYGSWNQVQGRGIGYTPGGTDVRPPREAAPASAPATPQRPTFAPPASQPSISAGGQASAPMQWPSATVAQPIQKNPLTSLLESILTGRLNDLSKPFDANADPNIQQTINAYNLGQERDARKQRAVAAERAAASGFGGSGALNAKIQGIAERQGQNQSMFAAKTVYDRMKDRDQQLDVALQLARATGQDDVVNQLEQQKLKLSEELGRADVALRRELGMGQLDVSRRQLDLSRELGLGQLGLGYDNLGYNYASLANSMNRDAILALLNGGK